MICAGVLSMGDIPLTAAHLIALVFPRIHHLGQDHQALVDAVRTGRIEALVEEDL